MALFASMIGCVALGIIPAPPAPAATSGSPIQHVVVVYMENHSFNDVLGKLCVLDDRCLGTTTGLLSDGSSLPLSTAQDRIPEIGHGTGQTKIAMNHGAMNGFEHVKGCSADGGYACYVQYDPSQIPNLAALARAFAISDETFNSSAYSSWVSHIALVAATKDGFQGNIPKVSAYHPRGVGWGCDSYMDAAWRPTEHGSFTLVPACIPDPNGNGPYRASPVPWVPTIMDRLDSAGLSWAIDGGEGTTDTRIGTGYGWSICPTFAECLYTDEIDNLLPSADAVTQAQNGTLRNVTFVTPTYKRSQHNNTSMAMGDNWIGSVVGAIMSGPQWSSTAIFITYDDCGCFYDPVPPPAGDGIRSPMVIVSPYARAGFTDSSSASTNSILAFIERTFGLAALGAADRNAYDYSGSFDFSQSPLSSIEMARTKVPARERKAIAETPVREGIT